MSEIKYVGIDLHQSTCLIAVHNNDGKAVSEAIVETRSDRLREFFNGMSGKIHVAFEVGTQSAWLYEILNRSSAVSLMRCPGSQGQRQQE